MPVISPEQCRAARAWLYLPQRILASGAGVGLQSIIEFELGRRAATRKTLDALQGWLEHAGVQFVFDPTGMPAGIYTGPSKVVSPIERHPLLYITPAYCRAGRGWLDWTQQQLAETAGVSPSTVRDLENERLRRGRRYLPLPENFAAMLNAFQDNRVYFTMVGGEPVGIEFKDGTQTEQLVA